MKNVKFLKAILCILCLTLTAGLFTQNISAAPLGMEPQVQKVFLDHYQLTDEKIIPGNEFKLTLFLKNIGDQDAKNVIVDVMYSKGVMPVYGTVSQAILDVPTGETTAVELSYIALEKIDVPALDFQILIRENEIQNGTVLRIPVGPKSPFDVIAMFVPAHGMVGENVNCSMTFKYLGKEKADRVRARVNVNGRPVNTVDIGNLSKETTKTQSLFEQFDEPGQYVIELFLDYQDQSGSRKTVEVGTSLIEIMDQPEITADSSHPEPAQKTNSQTIHTLNDREILMLSGVMIMAILLAIVFLIKKNK